MRDINSARVLEAVDGEASLAVVVPGEGVAREDPMVAIEIRVLRSMGLPTHNCSIRNLYATIQACSHRNGIYRMPFTVSGDPRLLPS